MNPTAWSGATQQLFAPLSQSLVNCLLLVYQLLLKTVMMTWEWWRRRLSTRDVEAKLETYRKKNCWSQFVVKRQEMLAWSVQMQAMLKAIWSQWNQKSLIILKEEAWLYLGEQWKAKSPLACQLPICLPPLHLFNFGHFQSSQLSD